MRFSLLLAIVGLASHAIALGTDCTASTALGAGTAKSGDKFWRGTIAHQGTAPFSENPASYPVFRDVIVSFGAKGDGVTDDTAAINNAIASGNRCGSTVACDSSTVTPAVVYFPPGTYLISSPINVLYNTQLIGDALRPPSILAASSFSGVALIDADPHNAYTPKNNHYRSVRNFVIDLRKLSGSTVQTGIHWQVSRATSLMNIAFEMSTSAGTAQQGIAMESGSGGVIADLTFNGGKYGIYAANQQFTVRNITVNNAQTGVHLSSAYGWTFQGVKFNSVNVGFDIITGSTTTAAQSVGSVTIIDSTASNGQIFLQTSNPSQNAASGSVVLNNIQLTGTPQVVYDATHGQIILAAKGGSSTIVAWEQGSLYHGTTPGPLPSSAQASSTGPTKPVPLLDSSGKIFGRSHPQYEGYSPTQFVSIKTSGAKGDGKTDDTAAIKNAIAKYAGCKIIFFDAGVYVVTSTITIPTGTQIVGEGWSVIMGSGSAFENIQNPQVVVQVGAPGSTGVLEITDMIFTTRGPAPGAIVVEWNAHDPSGQQGVVGAWDTHIRLGGTSNTNLDSGTCASSRGINGACFAAYLGLHLTAKSSAYLEGLWVWLSDHDLDASTHQQLTVYSGRGVLSESAGPVWLIGTSSEHHVIYQYALVGASNHYLGFVQGETPFFEVGTNPVKKRSIDAPAAATKSSKRRFEFSIPARKATKRHSDDHAAMAQRSSELGARHASPFAHGHSRRRIVQRDPQGITAPFPSNSAYHDPSPLPMLAYGLYIRSSSNIIIFGAGFYSSYQGYSQSCLSGVACQNTIVNIDGTSTKISIYGLSTVGATYMLDVGTSLVAKEIPNLNGAQQTISAWNSTA